MSENKRAEAFEKAKQSTGNTNNQQQSHAKSNSSDGLGELDLREIYSPLINQGSAVVQNQLMKIIIEDAGIGITNRLTSFLQNNPSRTDEIQKAQVNLASQIREVAIVNCLPCGGAS